MLRWLNRQSAADQQHQDTPVTNNQYRSPASTSLDELVGMRDQAQALRRSTRKKSAAPTSGAARSQRLGRGLDFAEVREYRAGDDIRMIDWKVTARTGKTHTKLFVEERERPVVLVVDFRSHMRFGTQGMFKSVMAARLSALLGWSATLNHDRVGGFVFTDDWHADSRPRSGRRGLMSFFRNVAEAQLHAPSSDRGQLAETLSRLRTVVHGGSTVILLSDFIGFDDEAKTAIGNLLKSLDLIAVHIVDPIECELPKSGRYAIKPIHSPSDSALSIDTASGTQNNRYLEKQLQHQQSVADYFAGYGHLYIKALTNQELPDIASRILLRVPDSNQTMNDSAAHP